MLMKSFFISLFQTVAIVCVVNGLFLYVYLNNSSITNDESERVSDASSHLKNCTVLRNENSNLGKNNTFAIHKKQLKIIYYKTHKTASTTVGSIIFRLGAQHGAHFLNYPAHYYSFKGNLSEKVDITLNHHYPIAYEKMMSHYKQRVPDGKFLSVLREPTRRYLSMYHYYVQPNNKSFESFLKNPKYNNGLAQDFGIRSTSQLAGFMKTSYNQFFFLITERLDECLLLLKNTWGWSLQDILYIKLNDACKKGINFERKPMSCRPKYGDLTAEQMSAMERNNRMDIALYERAVNDTNTALALQPESFWNELAVYKQMLLDLQSLCRKMENKTIPSSCEPYYWDDVQYEKKIRDSGGLVAYPVFSVHFDSF